MAESEKKLSFTFNKTLKKGSIPKKLPKKGELIEYIENKSIKLTHHNEETSPTSLVINIGASRNISDRIREAREKRLTSKSLKNDNDNRPDSELTLDELAAKELLQDSQNNKKTIIDLPQLKENTVVLDGKEESSLKDYEDVPISEFGFAMLRGMGWKNGMSIGKRQKVPLKIKEPTLRPKGMGLGVSKLLSKTYDDDKGKNIEEEITKKGTLVKVIAGRYKDCFGEIQSLDDESGRVIVKTANDLILSLTEYLIEPITKAQYEAMLKL
ncbi:G-patch domain and KOW motifs-containing protein-like [Agrilus planipennis]|uniref:G-patch domain and KOW motifs-containing protein-like n=1 Tax=Agrilus planipennis TaxID=224129 RepID=A0A1W4WII5_AGRPL|nr:G-patch domain and KOW motifs-containing protein-like [Agrilus planipennis]